MCECGSLFGYFKDIVENSIALDDDVENKVLLEFVVAKLKTWGGRSGYIIVSHISSGIKSG